MKNFSKIGLLLLSVTVLFSCSDSNDPEIVNEEEVITTLIATLTPQGGGTAVILTSRDLDGNGPNDPVESVNGNLSANTTYTGEIQVLNELENPAEDITLEVKEEADEHQFFITPSNNIATIMYTDSDGNGDPIGVEFTLTTGAAGSGNLTITLKHEPNKAGVGVSDGDITNAGGETDVERTFSITVQ